MFEPRVDVIRLGLFGESKEAIQRDGWGVPSLPWGVVAGTRDWLVVRRFGRVARDIRACARCHDEARAVGPGHTNSLGVTPSQPPFAAGGAWRQCTPSGCPKPCMT